MTEMSIFLKRIVSIKDVPAKIFQSIEFFQIFTAARNAKKLGVTNFVSEIMLVESYPDFEKLAHIIQYGLQGFRV